MAFCNRHAILILLLIVGCGGEAPPSNVPNNVEAVTSEHAVFVHLKLSDNKYGTSEERDVIHELSNRLEQAIDEADAGEFDGDEFGGGECTLFMYGPDADVLFSAVEPILRESLLVKGGYAIKLFGDASDPNAKEVRIDF